jgi:glycosyltransferase involved in cell wall biosynthesis
MIYFGSNGVECKIEESAKNKERDNIIYGRGGDASKCPSDMVEVFNQIPIYRKVFHIAGRGVRLLFNPDENIKIFDHMSKEDWYLFLKKIDVFFYQLPLNSYAAIDGVIGHAMLLEKPIVYFGPQAPKELIIHGKTGFIAETKYEMVRYGAILGINSNLRARMGKAGKQHILENFNLDSVVINYKELYSEAISDFKSGFNRKIPIYIKIDLFLSWLLFRSRAYYNEAIRRLKKLFHL